MRVGLAVLLLSVGTAYAQGGDSGPRITGGSASVGPSYQNLQAAAGIELSTPALAYSGETVEVSWSGIQKPGLNDAVALLVPSTASLASIVPARYIWVGMVPGWQSGGGSYNFTVLNQRANVTFLYLHNVTVGVNGTIEYSEDDAPTGFQDSNMAAVSEVLSLERPDEPTQVHLAYNDVPFTSSPTGQVVAQWTTTNTGTPTVQWGTSATALTNSATGNYTTYLPSDLCGAPANASGYIFPGYFNGALMSKLPASTRVFYRVGDPALDWSPVYSFLTPPPVGPNSTVYLIAWADSGQANADLTNSWDWTDNNPLVTAPYGTVAQKEAVLIDYWQQDEAQQGASLNLTGRITAEVNAGKNTSLFIFNGDLSYARGSVAEWDTFGDQYQEMFTQVPVMTLPGNHERDWPETNDRFYPFVSASDSGGECGVAYEKRFRMPLPADGQQWYSFQYGPITFLQMSTEQPFGAGSPQWQWIVTTLKAVNRTQTPWVILGLHRPIYTPSMYGGNFKSDQNVAADLRDALEQILYVYQVDMTWAGHVHLYGRTCPVYAKTCLGYNSTDGTALGPVHVQSGNGGFEFTWFADPTPPPYWDSFYMEHGYMRVQANGTHLHYEEVSSDTGNIIDEFTLTKPAGWQPNPSGQQIRAENFISNYTRQNWWEDGISNEGWWSTPVYDPATDVLQSNPALLEMLNVTNTTLLNEINVGDTVLDISQVLRVYYEAFQSPQFQQNTTTPAQSNSYLNDAILPLLQLYFGQAAAASSNPNYNQGAFTPSRNEGAPGVAPTAGFTPLANTAGR